MYFYCQSYQAFNLALSLGLKDEVIIITSSENIIRACEYLKIKYLQHVQFSHSEIITRKDKCLKEINRLIKIIGNEELHFSHTQFAVFCFLLVHISLEKKNKIIFHNFEFVYSRIKRIPIRCKEDFLLYTRYFFIKMFYNAPIVLGMSNPGLYMICLSLDFINCSKILVIDNSQRYYAQCLFLFKTIKIPGDDIGFLFIAQNIDSAQIYNKLKVKEVLSILNTPTVYVKMHPKLGRINGFEKCQILPEYLPVELYFNKVRKCVISFHSASLITASKFSNLKVISLIGIVEHVNSFTDQVKKDLIIKSNNQILFPESIEEFKRQLYD